MTRDEALKPAGDAGQTRPPTRRDKRRAGRNKPVVVAEEMVEQPAEPVVWLTREQVCKRLNISLTTLNSLDKQPGFPVFRRGRLVRYAAAAVDEWVKQWHQPDQPITPPVLQIAPQRARKPRS